LFNLCLSGVNAVDQPSIPMIKRQVMNVLVLLFWWW